MDLSVIHDILMITFPGYICFIFIMTFMLVDKTFPPRILNFFILAVISSFCLLITESLEYYFVVTKTLPFVRLIFGSLSFGFRIQAVCSCVSIAERKHFRKCHILQGLAFVNWILSILNIWTGLYFKVNPDFSWSTGFLFAVPYVIILIYMVCFIIFGITQIHKNLGEAVIIFSTCAVSILANMMEIFLGFHFTLAITFTLCMIFYFLSINVQMYRRDTLTRLLNRRSFYMDIKRKSKNEMMFLSMDLNDLKKFNDLEGHQAGDLALTTSTEMMHLAFKRLGTVYRTGGDEFIAVFVNKSKDRVEQAVNEFQALMAKTRYTVACGLAEYNPGDDVEKVIEVSDARMYENKKLLKSATPDSTCR